MANEFVARKGIISLSGVTFPSTGIVTNYTLTNSDYLIDVTANTVTVTLPTAVGINGRIYVVKNSGSGTVTVVTTSSQTIDGVSTKSLKQYDSIEVTSDGSNWMVVAGNGSVISSTTTKSGTIPNTYFSGTPQFYSVVFTNTFPNSNYSVTVTGGDSRLWTIESLSESGFTINSNSNVSLSYSTYWIASQNIS